MKRFRQRMFTATAILASLAFVISLTLTADSDHEKVTVNWVFAERNPKILAFYDDVIARFEAEHPHIDVNYRYLARWHQRLPTLVASPNKPDILYTQGGSLLRDLFDLGAVRDVTDLMEAKEWRRRYSATTLADFQRGDAIIGVPHHIVKVDFYYNKTLFADAGLHPDEIVTWKDFFAAADALRALGVAPVAAGPGDPWNIGIYFGAIAMRTCGYEEFQKAIQNEGAGFVRPCMIAAATLIRRLGQSDVFQSGFEAAKYPQALGLFADGKAAMILSYSATTDDDQRKNASDGVGLAPSNIGILSIPLYDNTPAALTESYAVSSGWALTTDSSPEAALFLRFLTSEENQCELGARGLNIPANQAARGSITDPLLRPLIMTLDEGNWSQTFVENATSASVGQVVFNVTVQLMGGVISAEEAVRKIDATADLS